MGCLNGLALSSGMIGFLELGYALAAILAGRPDGACWRLVDYVTIRPPLRG